MKKDCPATPPSSPASPCRFLSWSRFFLQACKDLRLYGYAVLLLFVFRLILLAVFWDKKAPESGTVDLLPVLFTGLRFDSRVAACFMLPSLLVSVSCALVRLEQLAEAVRRATAIVFTLLTLAICGATIPYFREYNDQFNQWVFGLLYDDRIAIATTIWSQVPVVKGALVLTAAAVVLSRFAARSLNRPVLPGRGLDLWPVRTKITLTLLFAGFLAIAVRGSIGARPIEQKDAGISRDPFLNKTVMNPYDSLRYLWQDYRKITSGAGLRNYLPDGDIAAAATAWFGAPCPDNDLDRCMESVVVAANAQRPRHIFLIVMEGYDSWPLLDRYASLATSPELKDLAARGIGFTRFLPGSFGTMSSLAVMVTGLPDAGVITNHQPAALRPFPTAAAPIFRRLGYRTRFFYGGYLSWQRVGDFCRNQGFEEIYGAPDMGRWVHGNEWGVDDEELFAFVEKTVTNEQPSFNLILSTSYHPPYDIDVYGKGYPVRAIPDDLRDIFGGDITLEMLGHLWYADQCLGGFVKRMAARTTETLFAITGDHWSRRFVNGTPTLFESSAVPCVLYGPQVLGDRRPGADTVGSHIDIIPTLVELVAPAGFVYHRLGRDLLSAHNPPRVAFGAAQCAMTREDIVRIDAPPNSGTMEGAALPTAEREEILRLARAHYALGWWRIMRGAAMPPGRP